jgi:hypothetical protein
MNIKLNTIAAAFFVLFGTCAYSIADETYVMSYELPGASMEQEITFHPSKDTYLHARDDILKRLKASDNTAMSNPKDGPWVLVETTAKIGLSYKGVGASSGRKNLRQISAADEALFLFDGTEKEPLRHSWALEVMPRWIASTVP